MRPEALLAVLCLGGCPADDAGAEADESSSGTTGEASSTGAELTNSMTDDPSSSTTSSGPMGTSSSSGPDAEASSSSGEPEPAMPTDLPTPTGTCPSLAGGDVVVAPDGVPERTVRLWMDESADQLDGPLVFYWHGTGSVPNEALVGLGQGFVDAVVAAGGIVVAPTSDPAAGTFPWFLVAGQAQDDLLVADEVLGCAIEQVGVDLTRIYSAGMSAGGLQTSQMRYRRSNYLASVVTYSGGFLAAAPPDADPDNAFAAMSFHGGPDDVVVISFQGATERYVETLRADGRFALICDHGNGHTIPPEQNSVGRFLSDHPYGSSPSPYVDGLPDSFPDYCALP